MRYRLAQLLLNYAVKHNKTYLIHIASGIAYGISRNTVCLLLVNEDSQIWFP